MTCCSILPKVTRRAFTLVEMLIVLVLIGVLAGSVVVSLEGRFEVHTLKAASKDVAASLRYASEQSRVTSVPHRYVFDDQRREFWIESLTGEGESPFAPVRGIPGRPRSLARGILLSIEPEVPQESFEEMTGLQTYVFASAGSVDASVVLSAPNGDVIRLEIGGTSGQIHLGK